MPRGLRGWKKNTNLSYGRGGLGAAFDSVIGNFVDSRFLRSQDFFDALQTEKERQTRDDDGTLSTAFLAAERKEIKRVAEGYNSLSVSKADPVVQEEFARQETDRREEFARQEFDRREPERPQDWYPGLDAVTLEKPPNFPSARSRPTVKKPPSKALFQYNRDLIDAWEREQGYSLPMFRSKEQRKEREDATRLRGLIARQDKILDDLHARSGVEGSRDDMDHQFEDSDELIQEYEKNQEKLQQPEMQTAVERFLWKRNSDITLKDLEDFYSGATDPSNKEKHTPEEAHRKATKLFENCKSRTGTEQCTGVAARSLRNALKERFPDADRQLQAAQQTPEDPSASAAVARHARGLQFIPTGRTATALGAVVGLGAVAAFAALRRRRRKFGSAVVNQNVYREAVNLIVLMLHDEVNKKKWDEVEGYMRKIQARSENMKQAMPAEYVEMVVLRDILGEKVVKGAVRTVLSNKVVKASLQPMFVTVPGKPKADNVDKFLARAEREVNTAVRVHLVNYVTDKGNWELLRAMQQASTRAQLRKIPEVVELLDQIEKRVLGF